MHMQITRTRPRPGRYWARARSWPATACPLPHLCVLIVTAWLWGCADDAECGAAGSWMVLARLPSWKSGLDSEPPSSSRIPRRSLTVPVPEKRFYSGMRCNW